jgi:hypothetical protein
MVCDLIWFIYNPLCVFYPLAKALDKNHITAQDVKILNSYSYAKDGIMKIDWLVI